MLGCATWRVLDPDETLFVMTLASLQGIDMELIQGKASGKRRAMLSVHIAETRSSTMLNCSGARPLRALRPLSMLIVAACWVGANVAHAQSGGFDYGRAEYMSNCSGCHGASGVGDGHFRQFLNRAPADLTALSRNNGGVFPAQRLFEVIDGRQTISTHGAPGEMPIWGASYAIQSRRDPAAAGIATESYVRSRIALLVDYLYRIQRN